MARIFDQTFADRVLPFDEAAAYAFAMISAKHRAGGRMIGELDSQVAAIALLAERHWPPATSKTSRVAASN
jgi:predicted nucleic acid-binding protein